VTSGVGFWLTLSRIHLSPSTGTSSFRGSYRYQIHNDEIDFDKDHLHFMADICLHSRSQVAKLFRGYIGKKFFEHFPELKLQKEEGGLLWKSVLCNPSYYIGLQKNLSHTIKYIQKQKYGALGIGDGQMQLGSFAA
jgi:REP element-mobilizing transposase RayT